MTVNANHANLDQTSVIEGFFEKDYSSLKEENKLKEQLANFRCIVSDINLKIKELDSEKKSLTTDIEILQDDKAQHTAGKQKASWNSNSGQTKTINERILRSILIQGYLAKRRNCS